MSVVAVELTDYQSHKRTRLELGNFTAIVGSSSSGKTALLRALSTLVCNSRGTSYVRSGSKTARVTVSLEGSAPVYDAQTHVSVERGSGVSVYELLLPSDSEPTRFTKCGTSVPDAVTAALDFGRDKLWLAGQFDTPFLLDETGSQIARVLGQLTGVSLVLSAVRECNRRALAARSAVKERREELKQVTESVRRYGSLPARRKAADCAEEALTAAQQLADRRGRLDVLVTALEQAQARSVVGVSPVPRGAVGALTALDGLAGRYGVLSGLIEQAEELRHRIIRATQAVHTARHDEQEARDAYREVLSASACPVCGASPEHQRLSLPLGEDSSENVGSRACHPPHSAGNGG